ncbi:MerR family transcriptional regulator [Evansella halocellulosilytica]|uniref:MerR family transcriptional regulator n=1 Tax=Evansella halocellulosilytica TaxID=2011013 RepID=UPI001C5472C6|nr:MerR family transcriptional regulator [Evansella halocellulosilytica]
MMRGSEIAKKLNISTSALKHYESWGIIPNVERASNGYRIYTKEHEAYFQCIRALKPGFGMDVVKEVMPLIVKGEDMKALWLINERQVRLHEEKRTAERAVQLLDLKELEDIPRDKSKKTFYSIGEVAKQANVSPSSIRHWEKEKLIEPKRSKDSGFRIFTFSDLRKVLIIRTVQKAVYSLDIVREVIAEMENDNFVQAREMTKQSLIYIDQTLVEQIKGVSSLNHLLEVKKRL